MATGYKNTTRILIKAGIDDEELKIKMSQRNSTFFELDIRRQHESISKKKGPSLLRCLSFQFHSEIRAFNSNREYGK